MSVVYRGTGCDGLGGESMPVRVSGRECLCGRRMDKFLFGMYSMAFGEMDKVVLMLVSVYVMVCLCLHVSGVSVLFTQDSRAA